jgi:hypothetical protein
MKQSERTDDPLPQHHNHYRRLGMGLCRAFSWATGTGALMDKQSQLEELHAALSTIRIKTKECIRINDLTRFSGRNLGKMHKLSNTILSIEEIADKILDR